MSTTNPSTAARRRPLRDTFPGQPHHESPDAAAIISARLEAGIAFIRDRVLAHLRSPAEFPLPANPESLERALLATIGTQRGRRLDAEIDAATRRLQSSGAARAAHYGELKALNARSNIATGDQVKALNLPSPLSDAERKALLVHPPVRAAVPGRLDLVLRSIECIDKTVHFPEIDGKDEIVIAADLTGVGPQPASRKVFVGKFRKGDVHTVSPAPFLSVNVADIGAPGAAALASFNLIEQDRGNDPPPPIGKGLVEALIYGAVGAAVFTGPSVYVLFGPGGAAFASGVLAASPVLAVTCGLVALTAATVLVVRLFQHLGIDEAYATPASEPVLLSAIPGLAGQTLSEDFVAIRNRDGFKGHYRLSYSWNLVEI